MAKKENYPAKLSIDKQRGELADLMHAIDKGLVINPGPYKTMIPLMQAQLDMMEEVAQSIPTRADQAGYLYKENRRP